MWQTVKELKERAADIYADAQKMVAEAGEEKRSLSDEERGKFEAMHAEAGELLQRADDLKTNDDLEKRIGAIVADVEQAEAAENTSQDSADDAETRAFVAYLRTGETRDLSAGSGPGSFTVPRGFRSAFVEVLRAGHRLTEAGVEIVTTDTGATYDVPILDDTAEGEIVSEGSNGGT